MPVALESFAVDFAIAHLVGCEIFSGTLVYSTALTKPSARVPGDEWIGRICIDSPC